MSEFHVVPGNVVRHILDRSADRVRQIVVETYLAHERGATVNPDSYFLRFPDKPDSRVIALPAYVGPPVDRVGLKWISSFPGNVSAGLPRASAVLILNDYRTGRPVACLESGGISAVRTAASAAVTARALISDDLPRTVAFIGAGVIAATVLEHLLDAGLNVKEVICHDLDDSRAAEFAGRVRGLPGRTTGLSTALSADVVVFATTAAVPYVPAHTVLRSGQLLLHISLRDLPPQVLLTGYNIVDDIDHCLKAETSPHLAERLVGNRSFIAGTIGRLLRGDLTPDPARPVIVSPFGLGALDVAVGHFVLTTAIRESSAIAVPGFLAGEDDR
ncbi:2,3-diaminopropionate biosynthesis protein SbnB [Nonomuraea sp. H19]|uniref:2,3-diaminopropionate biosynthesis protein SbnB n=1 Tax=Nonomuraea sp. H19 TaxID=3452206 RepID=UPI003F8BE8AA